MHWNPFNIEDRKRLADSTLWFILSCYNKLHLRGIFYMHQVYSNAYCSTDVVRHETIIGVEPNVRIPFVVIFFYFSISQEILTIFTLTVLYIPYLPVLVNCCTLNDDPWFELLLGPNFTPEIKLNSYIRSMVPDKWPALCSGRQIAVFLNKSWLSYLNWTCPIIFFFIFEEVQNRLFNLVGEGMPYLPLYSPYSTDALLQEYHYSIDITSMAFIQTNSIQ